MSTTFSTVYEYGKHHYHGKSDAAAKVVLIRAANAAMRMVAGEDHPYYLKQGYINLIGSYQTGTVTVQQGSSVVSGASTVWTSGMTGRYMKIGSEPTHFLISTFTSASSLTFAGGAEWPGSTVSGQTYAIYEQAYDLPSDFRNSPDFMESRAVRRMKWLNNPEDWYANKFLNHAEEGDPRWGCFANGQFWAWPPYTSAALLSFMYYRWPNTITSTTTVLDIDDDLIDLFYRAYDVQIALEREKQSAGEAEGRFDRTRKDYHGATKNPHRVIEIGSQGDMDAHWGEQYTIGDDEP